MSISPGVPPLRPRADHATEPKPLVRITGPMPRKFPSLHEADLLAAESRHAFLAQAGGWLMVLALPALLIDVATAVGAFTVGGLLFGGMCVYSARWSAENRQPGGKHFVGDGYTRR